MQLMFWREKLADILQMSILALGSVLFGGNDAIITYMKGMEP